MLLWHYTVVQANAMANNPDMSERQKLKVIQSALRKGTAADKPTKAYVVAKKSQGGKPSAAVRANSHLHCTPILTYKTAQLVE